MADNQPMPAESKAAGSDSVEFQIVCLEEAQRFDALMRMFLHDGYQGGACHWELCDAWRATEGREDHARVFAALLDIWLAFTSMHMDMHGMGATWNDKFSKGQLEGGSILESEEKFFGKMRIHHHSTGFILRCRAFWDKWMGIIVLLLLPMEYEKFLRAKSRRRYFERLSVQRELPISADVALHVSKHVSELDSRFRTAEAHGAGVLRKWTLSMMSLGDNDSVELVRFWNVANCAMLDLGRLLGARSTETSRSDSEHDATNMAAE